MYRKIAESQTLLINTQSKKLIASNKKIIKFGFGQSPFLPPKIVVKALGKAVAHKEYSSVQGDPELRALISKFHFDHNGLKVLPDDILIAPGSKVLIYTIMAAFKKADVFIPAPSWVSYEPQATLAGHNTIRLNTSFEGKWRITPELLTTAFKSKKHKTSILILNYPGNPDGLTYKANELKAIAKVAKKLDILVISDEIYGLLDHNMAHLSLTNYYPEKTITTTGLSKWCGAGGWRLGVAMLHKNIEPDFRKALIGIGSETYSCAPTPVQIAARTAYSSFKDSQPYIKKQIDIYKAIGTYCADKLNEYKIKVHPPEGGFYLFPDFSEYREVLLKIGISTSNQLCAKLLSETGVALLPGTAFGFDEEFLSGRLAYVDFEEPQGQETFHLEKDAPNIVEGIRLITEWVSKLH